MLVIPIDPVDTFPGDLTIGEILPGFENITSQPKLTVTDVPIWEVGDQHFQVLLDADGIIGPTGQPVKVKTAVDETKNKKQVTAIVDTGFSLSQVPRCVQVDAAFLCSVPILYVFQGPSPMLSMETSQALSSQMFLV